MLYMYTVQETLSYPNITGMHKDSLTLE